VNQLSAQKPLLNIKQTDNTPMPVVSYMRLIQNKNKPLYNDSLSKSSASLLKETLLGLKGIQISDTSTVENKIKYEKEVESLLTNIIAKKNITAIKLTPFIDSLISNSGNRFNVIILASGFSRGQGNYGKEIAKSVGVGLLTLGMYTPIPYKASSNLYLIIADAQNHSIAFYNRSNFIDKEPLNKKVLIQQFQNIFKGLYNIEND
jgi:hypothetical protein